MDDYNEPIKTKGAFNENYVELESTGDRYKNFSLAGCLNEIHPYLKNLTDNIKESTDTGKINLPVIIFRSSKDKGEVREMFFRNETV